MRSQAMTSHQVNRGMWVLLALLLVSLFGPFVLLAYPLQRWASKQIWDAQDRWETIWGFALFGWPVFLALILFHIQFVQAWQQLDFLGPVSLVSWRFRSFLMLWLVPTATLLLEWGHPQTLTRLRRVRSPLDVESAPPASQSTPARPEPVREKTKTASVPKATEKPASPTGPSTAKKQEHKRDPRPLGEVLYEEKQRRMRKTAQTGASLIPEPAPPPINWDEGEGTYNEH